MTSELLQSNTGGSLQGVVVEPSELTDASKPSSVRLSGFEWLRFAACIGIVWFHVKAPGGRIGYSGLPILMAMSVAFALNSCRGGFRAIVRERGKRLLVPWIFWSLVFAAAKGLHAGPKWWSSIASFDPLMLLAGPSSHLWYLPFAFVVTCIASVIGESQRREHSTGFAIVFYAMAVGAFWLEVSRASGQLPSPVAEWSFALPSVFIGLMLGEIAMHRPAGWLCSVCCLVAAGTFWLVGSAYDGNQRVPYACGLALLSFAYCGVRVAGPWVMKLGSVAFGVYLVHPLVASAVLRVTDIGGVYLGVAVVLITIMAVIACRRSPLRRFM